MPVMRKQASDAELEFFVPHLRDDPSAADVEWQRYLRDTPAPTDSRQVYEVTYHHKGSKFVATVGEERLEYTRRRGPRGGHIAHAELNAIGRRTGTKISGIIDAGNVLHVWTYGPPFGGWANPSLIGSNEVEHIEYFASYTKKRGASSQS